MQKVRLVVDRRQRDNFADPQTKYLTTKVWLRHLHYTVEVESCLPRSDSAAGVLVVTCFTPPRLSEPPEGDSLDVVPPMDLNSLFYLRDGGPVSPHDERPYPDTLSTHRGHKKLATLGFLRCSSPN